MKAESVPKPDLAVHSERTPSTRRALARLQGRICADWSSPLACVLVLGGTPLAVYGYVQANHVFATASLVSALFGGVLYGRISCLAPWSRLGSNAAFLGERVRRLSEGEEGLSVVVQQVGTVEEKLDQDVKEAEAVIDKRRKHSETDLAKLKEVNTELLKTLKECQLSYASLKAKYDLTMQNMQSQVKRSADVTNELVAVNTSLHTLQLNAVAAKKGAIEVRVQQAKALDEFKVENATMEQLVGQLEHHVYILRQISQDIKNLESGLQELVTQEGALFEQGKQKLEALDASMAELTRLIQDQTSQATALAAQTPA